MRYSVYHRNDLGLCLLLGDQSASVLPSSFHQVAEVEAENLEEVFSLTNTREEQWWEHPHVTPVRPDTRYRSTSVGDVVVQGEQVWIVEGMGFRRVAWAQEEESYGEEKGQ